MTAEMKLGAHEFGLIFDETAWPLLYVRFPSKPLGNDGFEHFIARYTDVVERRVPFATILDSRGLSTAITAQQRKRLTEWFEVTGPIAGEHHFGIAVLMGNAIIRGALKAVTWVAPIPVPVRAFGSVTDCAPWIREIFADRDIPLNVAAEALLKNQV
jgi:hypothetical protein